MSKTILLTLTVLTLLIFTINSDPTQQQLQVQQQELSMKRTACLVLSRYHSNTQKQNIEGVVSQLQPQQQQKYINKMYATAIQYCMPKITSDQAQKFFVEDPNFSAEELFYIYDGFDYTNIDFSTFTKNQQNLIKFIKNFDEEMQVRKQQKQAEKDINQGQDTFDMKFFGLSHKDIPQTAKYLYIGVFAVAVIGAIWYLMSKIDPKDKKQTKKKKSSPAKAASPSKSTKKQ